MAFLSKKKNIYYIVDKESGKAVWTRLGKISYANAKTCLNKFHVDDTYLRLDLAPNSNTSFADLVKEYLEFATRIKSENTIRVEAGLLNKMSATLGKKRIGGLKVADYEAILVTRPNHRRLQIATLRSLYKYAISRQYLKTNVAIGLKRMPMPALPPRYVDPETIYRVLAHATPASRVKLELLYYTGMRPSEMLRLQVRDILLKEGLVTVRFSKTKKFRTIPMHSKIVEILKMLVRGKKPETYLFANPDGSCQRELKGALKRACEQAKVKVTPYQFRHTFATEYLRKTGDLRGLQQILGHSDIRQTTRYAHVRADQLKQSIEMLE